MHITYCKCDGHWCQEKILHHSDDGWPPGWFSLLVVNANGGVDDVLHFHAQECLSEWLEHNRIRDQPLKEGES